MPQVGFLAPGEADDTATLRALVTMVNTAYTVADAGLWTVPFERTNLDEVVRHVRAGELAVAVAADGPGGAGPGGVGRGAGAVVGCVRVRRVDDATGEFGLLAADPGRRSAGVGRELVRFAERTARAAGRSVMELELMAPRDGPHPAKDFLAAWYARLGYRPVGRSDLAEVHPGLGDRLARPCDFLRYRKQLTGTGGDPPRDVPGRAS